MHGEVGIVLQAALAFLLQRDDDLAVLHQARSAVMVEGGESQHTLAGGNGYPLGRRQHGGKHAMRVERRPRPRRPVGCHGVLPC